MQPQPAQFLGLLNDYPSPLKITAADGGSRLSSSKTCARPTETPDGPLPAHDTIMWPISLGPANILRPPSKAKPPVRQAILLRRSVEQHRRRERQTDQPVVAPSDRGGHEHAALEADEHFCSRGELGGGVAHDAPGGYVL